MKMHSVNHGDSRVYSQDQKNAAAFLFVVRHSIGFSAFLEPLVEIFPASTRYLAHGTVVDLRENRCP